MAEALPEIDQIDDSAGLLGNVEQLHALALTTNFDRCKADNAPFPSAMRNLQRYVRLGANQSAKQTTIEMF